MMLIRESDIKT